MRGRLQQVRDFHRRRVVAARGLHLGGQHLLPRAALVLLAVPRLLLLPHRRLLLLLRRRRRQRC